MEVIDVQTLVVGAGVIGLAVAKELSERGEEVLVLEKESAFGTHTSSRNSEVIHAGLYYPTGSLKAQLCVEGRKGLYEYCKDRSIPHKKCGKIVVATNDAQFTRLAEIKSQAEINGCTGLTLLSQAEVSALEPDLYSRGGLYSPETGIIDSHALMVQFVTDIEKHSGMLVYNSEVKFLSCCNAEKELELNSGQALIRARKVLNCCGLQAIDFERNVKGLDSTQNTQYFAKGSYFSYSSAVPFQHLVYPVPVSGGLGTHLTLDMQGRAKFGPDVEWLHKKQVGEADYVVCPSKQEKFYNAIKEYWPQVNKDLLIPDYAGIRPKISAEGEVAADFRIVGKEGHGIDGYVSLQGIESPGLTSSLAIARYVVGL